MRDEDDKARDEEIAAWQQHAEAMQSAAVSALGWMAFWLFVVPVAVALVVVVASFFW